MHIHPISWKKYHLNISKDITLDTIFIFCVFPCRIFDNLWYFEALSYSIFGKLWKSSVAPTVMDSEYASLLCEKLNTIVRLVVLLCLGFWACQMLRAFCLML